MRTHWMRVVGETIRPDEIEIVGEGLFGSIDIGFDAFLQCCKIHRFEDD